MGKGRNVEMTCGLQERAREGIGEDGFVKLYMLLSVVSSFWMSVFPFQEGR